MTENTEDSSVSDLLFFLVDSVKKTKIVGPTEKVAPDEVVIGKITDRGLKRYFSFLRVYEEELKKAKMMNLHVSLATMLSNNHHRKHDPESCHLCTKNTMLATSRSIFNGLNEIFWANVRKNLSPSDQVKTARASHIAIRKGWKIVIKPKGNLHLLDQLRDLLHQEDPLHPPTDPA